MTSASHVSDPITDSSALSRASDGGFERRRAGRGAMTGRAVDQALGLATAWFGFAGDTPHAPEERREGP